MPQPSARFLLPLLICLFAWVSPAAVGQTVTDTSVQAVPDVIRFNVSPRGYPPYLIVASDGNDNETVVRGIIWDVLTAACERLDCDVKPRKVPRKRVDQLLQDGYIDATARARQWTDNPGQFLFTDPIVPIREVFFYRSGDSFEYESPDSLDGKTVLTHLGYHYPAIRSMFDKGRAERFDVPQDADMFRYLLHGPRFDVAVADRLVGQWLIRQHGWQDRFSVTENSISNVGFGLMLRPGLSGFVSAFNRELARMKQNGRLNHILSRYR